MPYMLIPILDTGLDPGQNFFESFQLISLWRQMAQGGVVEEPTEENLLNFLLAQEDVVGIVESLLHLKILMAEASDLKLTR